MSKITLKIGEQWIIRGFQPQIGTFRQRLLDMGLLPGTLLKVVRIAPLRDPVVIHIRGYDLSLRKAELRCLVLEKTKVAIC